MLQSQWVLLWEQSPTQLKPEHLMSFLWINRNTTQQKMNQLLNVYVHFYCTGIVKLILLSSFLFFKFSFRKKTQMFLVKLEWIFIIVSESCWIFSVRCFFLCPGSVWLKTSIWSCLALLVCLFKIKRKSYSLEEAWQKR